MNSSRMPHATPDQRRRSSSPHRAAATVPDRGDAGRARLAARPGQLACGVAAALCLVATVSACSGAASAPHGRAAQSRPAAAAKPATAAPSASAPASAAPAPAAVPRCLEAGLATAVSGYQVGGGEYGIILELTNTGSASCALYGVSRAGPGRRRPSRAAHADTLGRDLLRPRPRPEPDHLVAGAISDFQRRVCGRRTRQAVGGLPGGDPAERLPPCRDFAVIWRRRRRQ